MGRKKAFCVILVIPFLITSAFAQEATETLSIKLTPGLTLPMLGDAEYFDLGMHGSVLVQYVLPNLPFLGLNALVDYTRAPIDAYSGKASLNLIAFGGGATFKIEPFSKFQLGAFGHGGYTLALLADDSGTVPDGEKKAGTPFAQGGLFARYYLLPEISIGAEAAYRYFFGLYNDLAVSLGASIHFLPRTVPGGYQPTNPPLDFLEISKIELEPVFPVFYKYYDEHPIGTAVVENRGKEVLTDVVVSFFVNQYMDNPQAFTTIERLEPGEKKEIEVFALFNNLVLDISESTKVSANLLLEGELDGEKYTNLETPTLRIHDRNALTWVDDRRVAAFVTMKDPTVLKFSKNVVGLLKDRTPTAINRNLVLAMAIHETLDLFGMTYVVDPSTPYKDFSTKTMQVDFIQFPMQSLEYKAGDCDDLSILYSALLESLGIETAFVTVPGHIYLAVALDISEQEARQAFLKPDDLIYSAGNTWLPVECTALGDGFLYAWQQGISQWREFNKSQQSKLLKVHDAWELYEPVGFSGTASELEMPQKDEIVSTILTELMKFVDQEIYSRATELEERIKSRSEDPKLLNSLGVLYARYGRNEQAMAAFERALAQGDYVPALVNMGNLFFLAREAEVALEYYERAYAKDKSNVVVVLCLARTYHALGNYKEVDFYHSKLKVLNRALAEKYAYLELQGESAARASEAGRVKEVVEWMD
jgi:tetratricopeptide (TPR) repeat protein